MSVRKSVIAALYEFEQMQSIPPSPPKCEECDWWSNEVNSDRRAHVKALHTQIAALITENAKLRVGIFEFAEWLDHQPFGTELAMDVHERARALLTEEGKP